MHWIINIGLNAAFLIVIVMITRQFEKRNPIEVNQDRSELITDWKLAGLRWFINQFLMPMATACALVLITIAGGGFIPLPSHGWWVVFSFVVLIIANDFYGYVMHYASHKIPIMWAMHSLHHSAEALTMVTGARHFWAEQLLFAAFFPVLGIIFKVPLEMVAPVTFFFFLFGDGFVHLNMRVSFGPLTLILNNPQYHRIHHSVEPRHWNKNFCKMFPIWDVIFGTVWKPGEDEFPQTGLVPSERATGFLDGFIWPLRSIVPRVVRTP